MWYDSLLDRGLVPDSTLRRRLRRHLEARLLAEKGDDPVAALERHSALVKKLREGAVEGPAPPAGHRVADAPLDLAQLLLGKHLKTSGGLWAPGVTTLDGAEEAMLKLVSDRAKLADGQNVLELGCGWGALTLFAAKRFSGSRIVAVTPSADQRDFVEAEAQRRGLANLKVVTCDLGSFDPATGPEFDRVVALEAFDRVRNYQELLARIGSWMRPDGRLLVQLATHRELTYLVEGGGEDDRVARGVSLPGLVPSDHLLLHFQENVLLEERWRVSGVHQQRTADAWLASLRRNRKTVSELLARTLPPDGVRAALTGWRLALLACSEQGGLRGGGEWLVSHYRFRRR